MLHGADWRVVSWRCYFMWGFLLCRVGYCVISCGTCVVSFSFGVCNITLRMMVSLLFI